MVDSAPLASIRGCHAAIQKSQNVSLLTGYDGWSIATTLGLSDALLEAGCLEQTLPYIEELLVKHGKELDRRMQTSSQPSKDISQIAEQSVSGTPDVLVDGPRLSALWKPPGWTVTILNQEVKDGGEISGPECPLQDWVAARYGQQHPIAADATFGHGLVHRLDRETSGPLVFAKDYQTYLLAKLQFVVRRVSKSYVCLCHGFLQRKHTLLDLPLRSFVIRGQSYIASRSLVAADGKPAKTKVVAVAHARCKENTAVSLVQVRLMTGRTHQIRAHIGHLGHPLVGDAAYGGGALPSWLPRMFLHSYSITMCVEDERLHVLTSLPPDLLQALQGLEASGGSSLSIVRCWQSSSGY